MENIGDGILFIDRKKAAIKQNKGTVNSLSGNYILKSGESKTIYNEFRAKAPVQPNTELFQLVLDGLTYAVESGNSLEAESLVVAEKATQTIEEFDVKVMEYNVYADRKYAQIKVTFNGNGNR
ncbi:hypothetical protein V6R21_02600 [Limibacter armeniacum]|uniref:hypothetical protein n=1 Tax=Limibacter armeniacum TaxID=466084 RepID=UPI002FE54E35